MYNLTTEVGNQLLFMVVEIKDLHKLILYNVAKLRNITCMADTEREPTEPMS